MPSNSNAFPSLDAEVPGVTASGRGASFVAPLAIPVLNKSRVNVAARRSHADHSWKWWQLALIIVGVILLAAALTFMVAVIAQLVLVSIPITPLVLGLGAWYLATMPAQAGAIALIAVAGMAGLVSLFSGLGFLTKALRNSNEYSYSDRAVDRPAASGLLASASSASESAPALAPAARALPPTPANLTPGGHRHSLMSGGSRAVGERSKSVTQEEAEPAAQREADVASTPPSQIRSRL